MASTNIYETLENDGFVKIKGLDYGLSIKSLSSEILKELRDMQLLSFPKVKAGDFGGYIDSLHEYDAKEGSNYLSQLYNISPGLPSLWRFASNKILLNIIIKELKLNSVSLGTVPIIRLDRPGNEYYSTPWHQDFWFSQSSEDSVVVWFPLTPLTEKMGYLNIIPTPSKYGIIKFKEHKNGREPFEPAESINDKKAINLPCDLGEILIFKQSLLHSSGKNISKNVRVSCQLRFNKMHMQKEGFSTFTAVQSEFVLSGQKKYKVI